MAHSLIFHYRAQNTFLGKSNPLSKLLILIFLCVPLAKASLPYAATVCAVLLCIFLAIRLPLSRFKASLAFFLIIALLIALTEPGGVKASLAAMLRFLDFILLSLLFADTTDPDDLARCPGPSVGRHPAGQWIRRRLHHPADPLHDPAGL
jgi:energy-coupling factor transporter transmembrane protein EcfT